MPRGPQRGDNAVSSSRSYRAALDRASPSITIKRGQPRRRRPVEDQPRASLVDCAAHFRHSARSEIFRRAGAEAAVVALDRPALTIMGIGQRRAIACRKPSVIDGAAAPNWRSAAWCQMPPCLRRRAQEHGGMQPSPLRRLRPVFTITVAGSPRLGYTPHSAVRHVAKNSGASGRASTDRLDNRPR
jgi:hypothetical protein